MRPRGGVAVGFFGLVDGDAEFVVAQAGGDVGVGLGIDVGVDAQRDRRDVAADGGDGFDAVDFGQALDVEAFDAGFEGVADFVAAFADAGKHGFGRVAAGGNHARQLAAGNDVEAAAQFGKMAQDAEVAVGFDGVADQRVKTGEGLAVALVGAGEFVGVINIKRGAEALGKGFVGDLVGGLAHGWFSECGAGSEAVFSGCLMAGRFLNSGLLRPVCTGPNLFLSPSRGR